jgi:hypothetical protein
MIGINSPIRLLRENWSNPASLAQELYAMFTAKGPVELDDTLTIRVPENKTALKVERQQGGDTYDFGQANSVTKQQVAADLGRIGQAATPTKRQRPQDQRRTTAPLPADQQRVVGPGPAASDQPAPPWRKPSAPLIEVAGSVAFTGKEPVSFSVPPTIANPETGLQQSLARFTADQVTAAQAASSTAPIYMGQVVDYNEPATGSDPNSAYTFQVQLYKNGPGGTAGSTVTVIVPQLAAGEIIPNGTWIAPIFYFGAKYYCQVPVWLE